MKGEESGLSREEVFGAVDPLELPRRIRQRIRECCEDNPERREDVIYLWAHVSEAGFAQPENIYESNGKPSQEHWLNVIDEAASLGVNWLVLSLNASLSTLPEVLEICKWAQDAHDVKVGVHVLSDTLSDEDIALIDTLDLSKTQLLVKQHMMSALTHLEAKGLKLMAADPQEYGGKPNCQGPAKMVYVDPRGQLYTCGLVEGNEEYHLGSIYEDQFRNVMLNPELPHKLADEIHTVSEGCDGCPALVANFFAI